MAITGTSKAFRTAVNRRLLRVKAHLKKRKPHRQKTQGQSLTMRVLPLVIVILTGLSLTACTKPINIQASACPEWLHQVMPIEAHKSNPDWQIKQIRVADEAYLVNCP